MRITPSQGAVLATILRDHAGAGKAGVLAEVEGSRMIRAIITTRENDEVIYEIDGRGSVSRVEVLPE